MPSSNSIKRNLFGLNTVRDINYVDDYTSQTWSPNSFNFDGVNNIFTGDSTISTTLNNAIVGSNKLWTLSFRFKKMANGTTQILFCRDKSSATSARQINVFFNSSNKLVISLYTNSSNNITFTSTDSFADSRSWDEICIVYTGTEATVTNRIAAYKNGFVLAGATVQTGTFTTINNITTPNVNIGGRTDAANYSTVKINNLALFNTNLSATNVRLLHNNRVPFDIRTNTTLNANLVMFLSASSSSVFTTNWAWTDLVGGGVFTSSGMVVGDLVADAPALKQIRVEYDDGQSNMVGQVAMALLEAKYSGALAWLQVWDASVNGYVDVDSTINNNQYDDPGNAFGMMFYLGDKENKRTRKTKYVLQYAVGGSAMTPLTTPSWCVPTPGVQPSGGTCWQRIYNTELPDLQDWELNNGYTIVAIDWNRLQGEKDSGDPTFASTFQTNQLNYYLSIKGRMESLFYVTPHMYDGLLSANQTHPDYIYKSTINTAKANIQAMYPNDITLINTDTCSVGADLAHYNKEGLITLANLFYNAKLANGL